MPFLTLVPMRKARALHDRLRAHTNKVHKVLMQLVSNLNTRMRGWEHMNHIVMELAQMTRQIQLDMRIDLTLRIDTVEADVNTVEQRADVMEDAEAGLRQRVDVLEETVATLQERLNALDVIAEMAMRSV